MSKIHLGLASLGLLAALIGQAVARPAAAAPLRLCADPANLPFSSARPEQHGVYVEIGEAIGRALNRPVEEVWTQSYFGKRNVRTTLLAGACDLAIGLPDDQNFMGPRLIFSKPIARLGYALVVPATMHVASIDDLKGLRVAVQFASPPQSLLALRDDIRIVTVMEPELGLAALAHGDADAAFVWGPSAGYANKTQYGGSYRVIPVAGVGMQWPAAIGFSRKQTALRDEVDQAIDAQAGQIEALKAAYGFPIETPITLSDAASTPPVIVRVAATDTPAAETPAAGTPAATAPATETPAASAPATETPAASTANAAAEGREIFNSTCAHCHGPDAVQAERRINLRLLHHRYGDRMDEVFIYTVTHGRPDKGMPNWSGIIADEDFEKIKAFLHTVQTD